MTAEAIARALGAHRAGNTWMARCPVHRDRTPSLAIREGRDGKVLLKCHAGCTQWQVIGVLRGRGIWMAAGGNGSTRPRFTRVVDARHGEDRERIAFALEIWNESIGAKGTLVETYLRSRGLVIPPPASLRFHAALKHPPGATWPAMVGLVTAGIDAAPVAIHRTFLARDGQGKAPVTPVKMMLGPCRGGVVRLGEAADAVMVGEGVETCLAAMQATGNPAWAALSTSGLRTLDLPDYVGEVIVLADADPPGEAAARACAGRSRREGRRVRIARPPRGKDFNDALLSRASDVEEFAI